MVSWNLLDSTRLSKNAVGHPRPSANALGFYISPGVLPGSCRLAIEAPGTQESEGTLTIQVQQDAVVDAVL